MGLLRLTMLIFSLMGFTTCNNNKMKDSEIDKFILKYNDVTFSELSNITISQRSRSVTEVVYAIGKFEGNLPVYFVTFDLSKNEVVNINRTNLEKTNTDEYLKDDEISKAITIIRKFDFFLLSVDSSENVFINPFYANEPPYFLRLKTATKDSIIRKGYVYELYKENWYLNKTRKKD